ncbi:MAG: transposase family protein [Thioploca sp.]|nr:transposase family protein [Thioploca sp.]
MTASIIEHFSTLKEPRIERKKLHALTDIMVLVIGGIISGAAGWEAIEEFGPEKLDWLRQFIP